MGFTPSSTCESQSSSNPLHVSAGGMHEPQAQELEQSCVPAEPQLVVQEIDDPRTQVNDSSVAPSQSSSIALQPSDAPGCTVASTSSQSVPVHASSA